MKIIYKNRSLLESKSNNSNKGTYVSMKVKNAQGLYDHYTKQGVNCVPVDEMHCTIAYSRKEFNHKITPGEVEIKCDEQIQTYLEPLGDEGCIVMKFESKEMQERFQKCIDEGATYDYDSYIPHITITMDGKNLNLKDITRPDFNIILYNETVKELDLNWKPKLDDKIKKEIKKKNNKDYENSLKALNESNIQINKGFKINNKIQELFTSNNIDIDSEQVEYFKKLLNDNRLKLASSIIGVVGGYLSACKLAQKVPGIEINGYLNIINNMKQFTKLNPLRSKREALIIAILTLCAYYAIQSGKSLFALIRDNISELVGNLLSIEDI